MQGAYNGFYYGSRLRFAHAFVMSVLFGNRSMKERFIWAFKMAFQHGKGLAFFVFVYKFVQQLLVRLFPKTKIFILSFFAGVIAC